jgi:hypothetical protein
MDTDLFSCFKLESQGYKRSIAAPGLAAFYTLTFLKQPEATIPQYGGEITR